MNEISQYVKRLSRRDPTLKIINLSFNQHTDSELGELVDCLLAHPDIVTDVYLDVNQLTDETGVKLAWYLAASSTIEWLDLSNNQLGSATYLPLAVALHVNSSLRYLSLHNNQVIDQKSIDAAFVDALRLNPVRLVGSAWRLYLYSSFDGDFKRLNHVAEKTASPSMLEFLLCTHIN